MRCGPFLLLGMLSSVLWAGIAHAEIIMDGSVGPAGSITGPDYDIQASYGSEIGSNLFHSFSQFNLSSGETAIFSGLATIERIIAGVTGGQASHIDGTLRNDITGADLFLLNPSGIFFGPNARLDLTGSFYATTANRLDLTDDGTFRVDTTDNSVLTAAPPDAFGFSTVAPAAITVSNSELAVASGKTLALVGGDITVGGGVSPYRSTLTAEDGRIELVSLGEAGLVSIGSDGLAMADSTVRGTVSITDMAYLNVNGPDVGQISIKADNLHLSSSSFLDATNFGTGVDGGIELDVRNELRLSDASYVFGFTMGSGDAPGIDVQAGTLVLEGGSQLGTASFGSGAGGQVEVHADNQLLITGRSVSAPSAIVSNTQGAGNAGNITIQTDTLTIDDGLLQSQQSLVGGTGTSGDITIEAGNIDVLGGGIIDTSTWGDGDGGSLEIFASGTVAVSGENSSGTRSTITSSSTASATGNAGRIYLEADAINIDSGSIQSATTQGDAGEVHLQAQRIALSNGGQIFTTTYGEGAGGVVQLTADREIDISGANAAGNRSGVYSNSRGVGSGGSVDLNAGDSITLSESARLSAEAIDSGNAGNIGMTTDTLSATDSDVLTTATQSSGGNIVLNANHIRLDNNPVSATVTGGTGDGGNVTINATTLAALDNSDVTARADQGQGGDITVNADVFLRSPDVDLDASSNLIGNDGNIVINAPELDLAAELEPAKASLSPATANLLGCAAGLGTLSTAAGKITLDDLSGPEGPWLLGYATNTSTQRGVSEVHTSVQTGLHGIDNLLKGKIDKAARNLQSSIDTADGDLGVKAVSLNNLGVIHRIRAASSGKAPWFTKALTLFDEAARIAQRVGMPKTALIAQANTLVIAPVINMRAEETHRRTDEILRVLETGESKPERIDAIIPAVIGASVVALESVETAKWPIKRLFHVAGMALDTAEQANDASARARVLGWIAKLYASQGRSGEAQRLYASAAALATNANMPEWSGYWWNEAGQLTRDAGLPANGFLAWERAAETLWEHRQKLASIWRLRGSTFRAEAGEVFSALVHLVLERPVVASGALHKVQAMWERFKTAEVAEYFGACMLAAVRPLADSIGRDPAATILYPIVLPNRLELLVQRGKRLERRTVSVTEKELTNTVMDLRKAIMSRAIEPVASEQRVKEFAHQLYQWLIAPVEHHLTAEEAIVLVPDGPFRLMPPGILHDGQRYLIERFPVVEIPSLSLVTTGLGRDVSGRILLAGLSREMATDLPNLSGELNNLERLFGRHRVDRLDDASYTKAELEKMAKKQRYSIVHLASHAYFDSVQGGGLLVTTGAEETMNAEDLAELVSLAGTPEIPVDILSLSACETALGDDRAALGLGGIAASTGARSALATLWRVDSAASFAFTSAFYGQLKQEPAAPRGKLLRKAVMTVRAKQEFSHPFYWAGFLLIGDWMG